MSKKYKIINGFYYKGPDGKSSTSMRYCPGEKLPELNEDEINRLLVGEKIAEISSATGEIIISKKIITLTDGEIERFLSKSPNTIISVLKNTDLSNDTLSKLQIIAEKKKLPNAIINYIEDKLSKRITA